jgi:hypothetical protein
MHFTKVRFFSGVLFLVVLFTFSSEAFALDSDSRLAIKLSGGLGYLSLAEMNTGIKGALNDIAFERDIATNSTYNDLKMGTDFGADLIFYLTPKIGVGIGGEFIHGRKTSTYSFTGIRSGYISCAPILTAVPLKFGLFFKTPLSGKINFTATIGAGYYRTSLDNTYGWEIVKVTPATTERFKVSAWSPGFHGGIGLEYSVSRRFALFFEALGRLAKVRGFKGTVQYTGRSAVSARLYSFDDVFAEGSFPIIDAWDVVPSGGGIQNVREATIDLSGVSAFLGVVIRF